MKEHPILFSAPMVKAILDGRKTQTRRVITPDPNEFLYNGAPYFSGIAPDGKAQFEDDNHYCRISLRYKPGDRLWVREAFCDVCSRLNVRQTDDRPQYCFRATARRLPCTCMSHPKEPEWRPSIFMPRWMSRISLIVTDVRPERLHDITFEDIKAEGVVPNTIALTVGAGLRCDFKTLWDSLNAKRGHPWESNSWVWKICFRKENA
jgi:hypothetical protein